MENHDLVNIMIAEDVESNFLYLEAVLKKLDTKILWAKNGEEAVNLVSTHKDIDLILMDLRMPVMDGYQAAKIIKKEYPGIPIIAQTAFALSVDREKVMEAGFDDYISKPISSQLLLSKITFHVKKLST